MNNISVGDVVTWDEKSPRKDNGLVIADVGRGPFLVKKINISMEALCVVVKPDTGEYVGNFYLNRFKKDILLTCHKLLVI